jgi:hypothetical protein
VNVGADFEKILTTYLVEKQSFGWYFKKGSNKLKINTCRSKILSYICNR